MSLRPQPLHFLVRRLLALAQHVLLNNNLAKVHLGEALLLSQATAVIIQLLQLDLQTQTRFGETVTEKCMGVAIQVLQRKKASAQERFGHTTACIGVCVWVSEGPE